MCSKFISTYKQAFIWLVYLCLSLLFHLAILNTINFSKTPLQVVIPKNKPLVVNLNISSKKPIKKTSSSSLPAKPSIEKRKPIKKLVPIKTSPEIKFNMLNKIDKRDITLAAKTLATSPLAQKTRAKKILTKAIDANSLFSSNISTIIKEISLEDSKITSPHIFDPHLRKKIQDSKQYYKKTIPIENNDFEIITQGIDSNVVRVGERCLRIPVETSYDLKNLRIMSFELNCPQKKKMDLFNN
jgi:hypothetical protein